MSYCARADIEDQFGVKNVSQWADLDNDGDLSKISSRITKAITEAETEINARLAGGIYTIPFTTIPTLIKSLTATFAGVWLYESRGIKDTDEEGRGVHRLSWHRKSFERKITMIRIGTLTLIGDEAKVPTYPQVVPVELE